MLYVLFSALVTAQCIFFQMWVYLCRYPLHKNKYTRCGHYFEIEWEFPRAFTYAMHWRNKRSYKILLPKILQVLNTMLQLTIIAKRILIVARYFETKSIQEVLRLFEISFPHRNVSSRHKNIVIISYILFLI